MNITIDKAADVVAKVNVIQRVFIDPKEKRYCAKCKTELSWYYAENANYIFFCKNKNSKSYFYALYCLLVRHLAQMHKKERM